MLTLYYVSSTFLQSWRIQKVCTKIAEQLALKSSVAFYDLQAGTTDGFDASLATSELCTNVNLAKVTDILWLFDNQRGCCLRPLQTLLITPWISFQNESSWLPFAYTLPSNEETPTTPSTPLAPAPPTSHPTLASDTKQRINLLLEASIEPNRVRDTDEEEVRLEQYGKLIAWKIDSHLAVLMETDVEHFTKLLISTFLRNNLFINDQLPLLRIESVQYEGKPQPFELLANHLKRSTRSTAELSTEAWQAHLTDLRALSVLAHQATEFEYNKNRTEGKTGVVKPDLIPQEKKTGDSDEKTSASQINVTPKVSSTTPSKVVATTTTNDESTKLIKAEADTTSASPNNTSNKMKAKPTEIKKPGGSVTDSRFKTSKVTESSTSKTPPQQSAAAAATTSSAAQTKSPQKVSPAKASSKTSELEKIAAATLARTSSPQSSPSSSVASKATTATPSKTVSTLAKTSGVTPTKVDVTKANKTIVTPTATPAKVVASSSEHQEEKPSTSASPVSASQANKKRPSLRRNKDSLRESKPLNVLVYSDSASARDSTVSTLRKLLQRDVYTIYPMTSQQAEQKYWMEQTALLVVCGSVAAPIGEILVDYFLHGGKVFSLCSDILHFILPNYRTAEVREHELVQFSYDKWEKVKMMHHIFCYQPSPVKKNFSTDSEESTQSRKPALVCPRSIELKDVTGQLYKLEVKVLGTEETWNTPSLLLANSLQSGGKAVFSQVHLETNPSEFEFDETKFSILKKSEQIRLEIFADLLGKYLEVEVIQATAIGDSVGDLQKGKGVVYKEAYFLGKHESKFDLLEKLKDRTGADNCITTRKINLKFCGKDEKPPTAGNNLLPILIHSCPEDFSTVDYFDNLKTKDIGRLVIYAPVVSSSMNVVNDLELTHGIAVIPRQQTEGVGRSNNQWLSPPGCVMLSIQLHINMDTPLGSRLPLIQHIIGAAMANTLRSHELYGELDISLKWPNDIYANGSNKIGGLVVNTTLRGSQAIVNIGCGINLDNSKPTVCINDLIAELNKGRQQKLPKLKYEQFIALMFNEIERLVSQVQNGDFESFYKLYYELWLHDEQLIKISLKDGQQQEAKITGINDYGYLKVQLANGTTESVQPDGNSFDMLKGLIVPKYN